MCRWAIRSALRQNHRTECMTLPSSLLPIPASKMCSSCSSCISIREHLDGLGGIRTTCNVCICFCPPFCSRRSRCLFCCLFDCLIVVDAFAAAGKGMRWRSQRRQEAAPAFSCSSCHAASRFLFNQGFDVAGDCEHFSSIHPAGKGVKEADAFDFQHHSSGHCGSV